MLHLLTKAIFQRKMRLYNNRGKYANVDTIALFCGVCKVNAAIAAQVLIDRYHITQIIDVGVAVGVGVYFG